MSRSTPRAVRGLVLMVGFLATSLVAGVLAAGLAMPLVGATGTVAQGGVSFFDSLPTELKRERLAEGSTVYAKDGKTVIAKFYDENRVYRPLSQISPLMQKAIVAIEDSRFYEHGGIDPRGVIRAVVNNSSGGDTQGASTLTQQYIKNVLVESAQAKGDEAGVRAATVQTKARKVREMKLAISLEKQLSKDKILEGYLNIAFFSQNTYGVEAASQLYFSKPAMKLTLPEAATLAGMVQQPSNFNPIQAKEASTKRRNVVLSRMLDLGMITKADFDTATAKPIQLKVKRPRNGCANAGFYGYYCDYLDKVITQNAAFSALGKTEEERSAALRRGGLVIVTTIDPKVQKAAQAAVNKRVPPNDKSQLGAAAVTVVPGTGDVVAMAQNRVFDPAPGSGRTAINYNTDGDFGGSSGFQTGSTFKAFTLAAWLRAGKSLNATVDGTERDFAARDFETCEGRSGGPAYKPANSSEGRENGPVSVAEATAKSINVAFVDMESRIGICAVARTAEALGVHLAVKSDFDGCKKKVDTRLPDCIPSLTLGVKEVAPLTMAAAYASFASGGMYCKPRMVTSITRPAENGGKPTKVTVPPVDCKRALSTGVAAAVNRGLRGPLAPGGTAGRIGGVPGHPSAGKTGTTNGPKDSWFVGYTAQRATAVWVADPGKLNSKGQLVRKTLRGMRVGGQSYGTIFGATIAAPIWLEIMKVANKGLPAKQFGSAPGNLLVSDRATVPNVLGRSVPEATRILTGAGFKVKVVRGFVPSKYPPLSVANTSPGPGSRVAKGGTISISVSGGGGGGGGNGGGNNGGGRPPGIP